MSGLRFLLSLMTVLWGIASPAQGAANETMPVFSIELKDGSITPARLEVPADTPFKIELKNSGRTPVEFESMELRKERVVAPGVTTSMVFKRLAVGEYQFFDDFHPTGDKALLVAKPMNLLASSVPPPSSSSTPAVSVQNPHPVRFDGTMPVYAITLKDGTITPQRLEVPAGKPFKFELTNSGQTPVEFESMELRKERVVAPGVTTSLVFKRLAVGEYPFFDDFHLDGDKALVVAVADLVPALAATNAQPPSSADPAVTVASSEATDGSAANAVSPVATTATESASTGLLGQVVFVIWRESVEALLIIGILNAWLVHQGGEARRRGRRFLWLGVLSGLALAATLGTLLVALGNSLSEEHQGFFMSGMVFVAAILILQMVIWMRRYGQNMRTDLEQGAARSVARVGWWGIALIATLAVAREGSETVVFLYGILSGSDVSASPLSIALAIALGLAAALMTYVALQLGSRILSWRLFFRMTEVMLLLLALSLIMTGVDTLVALDALPSFLISQSGPVLDIPALLAALFDTRTTVGSIFASLTGYRPRPDMTNLLVYALYLSFLLLFVFRLFSRKKRHAAHS